MCKDASPKPQKKPRNTAMTPAQVELAVAAFKSAKHGQKYAVFTKSAEAFGCHWRTVQDAVYAFIANEKAGEAA